MTEKVIDNIEATATTLQSASAKVGQSVANIRNTIVNETAKIAYNVPGLSDSIEKHSTAMLKQISMIEADVRGSIEGPGATLSVESLYKPLAPEENEQPETLKAYTLVTEYSRHLDYALANYDDAVTRENELTLFQRIVFEFDYLRSAGDNFSEMNTALKVALLGQNTKPYSKEQIAALIKVMKKIKKDIRVTDRSLNEILDILDENFNLAGPLAFVEYIE